MHGLRILGNETKASRVPLKAVGVDVTIKGFVANVQSTLTYENEKDTAVETVFVFPVDDQSAVYHFEADIDGRHIVAECQDKTQARETYKDALETGHTAMLLSESDTAGDTFECKLGNLPPHKVAMLTFSYVTELTVDSDGVTTFTLPTVLNPRYTPAGFEVPAPSSDAIHYTDIPYQMRFVTKVEGQHLIKNIVPKKETMKVDISEDKKSANITLDDAVKFKFDHDLALTLEYEDVFKPTVILEKGREDKDGFLKSDVVMVDFLPDLRSVPEMTVSEFIFVIDCSESMRGERIAKAKETVLLLLKSLPVGCSFNLVAFGSSFNWWFPSSKKYGEESLKEALKLQKALDANLGGTEILQPLKSLYAQKTDTFRQVFLLTDGEVSNTSEVIKLARENALTTRIFTFGIGSGASTSLTRNVAKVTNGLATFVKDNEKLQNKVMAVLKCAMQQPITNLKLEWTLPPGCNAINIPRQVPPVFKGGKVIAYALVQGEENLTEGGQSSVSLKGDIGKENTIQHTMTFDLITKVQSDESFPVHRLAAKAQIKDYEINTTGDTKDDKKGEITLVSISANVVCQYTAFVGVDKEKKELVDGCGLQESVYLQDCYLNCVSSSSLMACDSKDVGPSYGLYSSLSSSKCQRPKSAAGFSTSFSFSSFLPKFLIRRKSAKSAPKKDVNRYTDDCLQYTECAAPSLSKEREGSMDSEGYSHSRQKGKEKMRNNTDDQKSNLMMLIDLQKFDGSWLLDDGLAQVFGISKDTLKAKIPDHLEEMVWATALSVACLRKKYMSEKALWEMIEKKALSWLSSQNLAGKTVEELLTLATDALTSTP